MKKVEWNKRRAVYGHIVVKWFLQSVLGYKASLPLLFCCFFWMISLQFSCNSPDWSWEEVNVASTYSSAVLDPYKFIITHFTKLAVL